MSRGRPNYTLILHHIDGRDPAPADAVKLVDL